jgi:hypothetical protein
MPQVVVDAAKMHGWLVYHTHDSRHSEPGFPDLVLVGARVIYVELKTQTGKMSDAQIRWRDALADAGAEWYLWRPGDSHEVFNVLATRSERYA